MDNRAWCLPTRSLFLGAGVFLVYLILHEMVAWNASKSVHFETGDFVADPALRELIADDDMFAALGESYTRGAKVFQRCLTCHSDEAGNHRYGPSLSFTIGSQVARFDANYQEDAGGDPGDNGYRYSLALRELRLNGHSWFIPELWAYVYRPREFIEGTRMPFLGLGREALSDLTISVSDVDMDADRKVPEAMVVRDLLTYLAWQRADDAWKAARSFPVYYDTTDPIFVRLRTRRLAKAVWDDPERSFSRLACIARGVEIDAFLDDPTLLYVQPDVLNMAEMKVCKSR